jgi:hypothetical protein
VITPAVLLNIPSTLSVLPRTLLRELRNRFDRRLHLLIQLLFVALPIIILFARFSLVPCILVHDADFEVACDTPENIPIDAVFVDLAGFAAGAVAPPEVGVVIEGFAGGKGIESNISNE